MSHQIFIMTNQIECLISSPDLVSYLKDVEFRLEDGKEGGHDPQARRERREQGSVSSLRTNKTQPIVKVKGHYSQNSSFLKKRREN